MIKKTIVVFFILFGLALQGYADDIKGYIIPEYYMVGSHHTGLEGIEGQHGFWMRRAYFGYNTDLGNGWSARLRLEMNSPAYEEALAVPFVKNVHLEKKLGGGVSILVGIIEPPSFDKKEQFWGYRFIEKTPADFFKFASSRDFGLALDGKTKGGLVYTLMYGNYGSNKGEDNKGKGLYGRLGWESKSAYVEANAYFAADNGKDIAYMSFFGGLKGKWGRFGLGYDHRSETPDGGESKSSGIISGFGAFKLGKITELFARYDHFTDLGFEDIGSYIPIPASQFESHYLMAGLNFKVHKMIQLSPNVKYVFYNGDNAPDGDFYFNLTAKISFKTKIGGK